MLCCAAAPSLRSPLPSQQRQEAERVENEVGVVWVKSLTRFSTRIAAVLPYTATTNHSYYKAS